MTWGSGIDGVKGVISADNSLMGSQAGDQVGRDSGGTVGGLGGVVALSGGGYVVVSSNWSNGTMSRAGAVTFGGGGGGLKGTISADNSLIGSRTFDQIGSGGITALTNGNYVVNSPHWSNGSVLWAGAVTWGSGIDGVKGLISSDNSLIGSQTGDYVGSRGIAGLTNGNYVVASRNWANGSATNAGAVTWGNGAGGVKGLLSADNSLVGSRTGDFVGSGGVTVLTNGNYVVNSPNWANGSASFAGAVTWGSGTAVLNGTISDLNSLIGSRTNDQVGSGGITVLTNGNYVVNSPNWSSATATRVDAVTWASGSEVTKGAVSELNSLVGSRTDDRVGTGGITALTNGIYVVNSYFWDNGLANDAGAVTWRSGSGGSNGAVSASNSLVGGNVNALVGWGFVTALSNGDYVVKNGSVTGGFARSITIGAGDGATKGVVDSVNSFTGTSLAVRDIASDGSFIVIRENFNDKVHQLRRASVDTTVASSNFADNPSSDLTISAANLASTLGAGTVITLQANNDITVSSAINVTGSSGGNLTLQAGRSIFINASIITANGTLTLIANETTANGVVNAQRDSGLGQITMASGTALNTGSGDLAIRINDGTGLTNGTAGDISLQTITAKSLTVEHFGKEIGWIKINAGATLTNQSKLETTNGEIFIEASIAVSEAGKGFTVQAGRNIFLDTASAAGSITTNGGEIVLNSDRDATDGGAIILRLGSSLKSNGGDIVLGGGANPRTGRAQGQGETIQHGVLLESATLDAGAGAILMRGESLYPLTPTGDHGVLVKKSTLIGRGGVTIDGIGPSDLAADSNGVRIDSSSIDAGTAGSISITGVAKSAGDNHHGVHITNGTESILFGSGGLSINGTASQDGNGVGVLIDNVSNISGSGNISITGKGGTKIGASTSTGVGIANSGLIKSTGGNITITGQRGLPRASNVAVQGGGTIAVVAGTLTIDASNTSGGTIPSGTALAHGFSLSGGSTLTTDTGTIKINGIAASGGAAASGILIATGTISATGSNGSIILSGTPNTAGEGSAGMIASAAAISTTSGTLTIETDTLALTNSTIRSTSGSTIIHPKDTSKSIGVNGGTGTLNLTTTMLDQITGSLTIGRGDVTGKLTVGSGFTLKQDLTLLTGSGGISLGTVDAKTAGGQSLTLATSSTGVVTANGAIGGTTALNNLSTIGPGIVTTAATLTIGTNSGDIKAVVNGKTGEEAIKQITLTPDSKITVNGISLPERVAPTPPPTPGPKEPMPPTTASVPTIPSTPSILTTPTVASMPTMPSIPTIALDPTTPTMPTVVFVPGPPVIAPPPIIGDIDRLQATILVPPVRPITTAIDDLSQEQSVASIGLNAAATAASIRSVPSGSLLPRSVDVVPSTGAPLTASPTIKVDAADSGGSNGQVVAGPSGQSTGTVATPVQGLSIQTTRPATTTPGRTQSDDPIPEIDPQAFLD